MVKVLSYPTQKEEDVNHVQTVQCRAFHVFIMYMLNAVSDQLWSNWAILWR